MAYQISDSMYEIAAREVAQYNEAAEALSIAGMAARAANYDKSSNDDFTKAREAFETVRSQTIGSLLAMFDNAKKVEG